MKIPKIFLIPFIISLFFIAAPKTFAQNTFSPSVTPIISQQFAQLIIHFKNLFTPFQQSFIKFAELSSVINNIKKQISDKGLSQEQITLRGIFTFFHGDNLKTKKSVDQFFVTNKETKERYEITFINERPDVITGDEVEIQGIAKGKKIVVDNTITGSFKVIRSKSQLSSSQKTASRKVAVILFNFSSNTQTPYTREQIKEKTFTGIDSVNAYYKENSFNKLELNGALYPDGDIFGWYTINAGTSHCLGGIGEDWATLAEEKAIIDGFVRNNYDNIIYLFPYTQSCSAYGGLAIIGGNQAWIHNLYSLRIVAHELGHNFGAYHANKYKCYGPDGNRVFIRNMSTKCTTEEYGDPFDIMGNSSYHMSNFHKVQSGEWINEVNIKDVTTSGEYTIVPIEYPASPTDIQLLRVKRIYGVDYYYLEFRQPYGFDNFSSTDHVVNGVTFRLVKKYYASEKSQLLDASSNEITDNFIDSALKEGKTVRDIERGITFTTLSISSSSATVKIMFEQPSPCVQANPTLTVTPQQQSIPLGGQAHYALTLTNNDSSWCFPSFFETRLVTHPVWFSFDSYSNGLNPGETVTTTIVIAPPTNVAHGIYDFVMLAVRGVSSYYAMASAELEITNQCVFSNPTLTLTPAQQYVNQNESASYNFTLTNNNSFLCPSSNFKITPTLPKTKGKWKQTPQSFTFDLSSGSSTTGTIAITPSSKMPFGTYTITETAINNTHDIYKTTSTVEFIVSDLIPPVVTITKPKASSTISQTAFVVSAKASDRSGIASLQLFLDGSEIGSCPKKKTCSAKVFTTPLSAGNHIIKALAIDPVPFSNISSSSVTVTIIK